MSEPPSFRWLPGECRQGAEDPYRLWRLCILLRADIRVEGNAIKIAKTNSFIECFHDLHMILFKVKGVSLFIKLVPSLISWGVRPLSLRAVMM